MIVITSSISQFLMIVGLLDLLEQAMNVQCDVLTDAICLRNLNILLGIVPGHEEMRLKGLGMVLCTHARLLLQNLLEKWEALL